MQFRANRFVCTANFTECSSICFQFSAILTEVRAKVEPEADKTSKSPLLFKYSRNFYLRNSFKKNQSCGKQIVILTRGKKIFKIYYLKH